MFCFLLSTHTHSGEEYYSLWQVYQPPLVSHRALLLRAWCSVPCVTYLPLEEPGQLSVRKGGGGGGVCVCLFERERRSWKHWESTYRQLLTQFWSHTELTMVQDGTCEWLCVCVRVCRMPVMDHWWLQLTAASCNSGSFFNYLLLLQQCGCLRCEVSAGYRSALDADGLSKEAVVFMSYRKAAEIVCETMPTYKNHKYIYIYINTNVDFEPISIHLLHN